MVLENVVLSDEGEYRCEAENVVGSISAVGSLIIQCKFYLMYDDAKFPCQIKKVAVILCQKPAHKICAYIFHSVSVSM